MSWVLRTRGLHAGYNGRAVVRDFDLEIAPGEVVAVLGPNGAGKTTVLSTLAGLLPPVAGSIEIDTGAGGRARRRSRAVVLLPDDRSLFRGLTAKENVLLGERRGGPAMDEVLARFPALADRLDVPAGMLSGGEQQQLAMARALVQGPKVLLIDELSMGLAPLVVDALLGIVRAVADEAGTAVVLVEQHVTRALRVADRGVALIHGAKLLDRPAAELAANPSLLEDAYFARHRER